MIGETISQYKILEKLGEGGMGVVYKAKDAKLDRILALKFLPHHLTANAAEQSRFVQEAKAASSLNHPNICTIHDLQEADGKLYIVMEYVEGMTLRNKIEAELLGVNEALNYAVQIADALQEAHAGGIVHRDIKPENIIVNVRNQIKVMDFGLAKLKGALKLTKASSTVGTLAYMAPEQIQGGEVDGRSDIFSFGVVLYEMLTGKLPFRGEHEAAMMYSILNEEPERAEKFRPDLSAEVLHILNRALEKDPEDRYQTVHDMLIDIRRIKRETSKVPRASLKEIPVEPKAPAPGSPISTTAPDREVRPTTSVTINIPRFSRRTLIIPGIVSVAVLLILAGYFLFFPSLTDDGERITVAVTDFVNETGEKELNGLSGMLITSLEQSRRLSVLPRSRMFDLLRQMGKEHVDRIDEALGKDICRQASISALVISSVRKFGRLYTIDLKILDPLENTYIFTTKEDGEGQESIPVMLDRLSEKIRIGLKEKTAEIHASKQNVAEVTTTNLAAYQHYFQGENYVNKLKFQDAIKEFKKAVALDSTFALAYYGLGYSYSWILASSDSARAPYQKALALIDRLPEKEQYLLRAADAREKHGYRAAAAVLKDAEQRFPNEKEILYQIGDDSYHSADFADAMSYLNRVLAMDPTHERGLQHLTWTYRDQGNYERMSELARRYVAASNSAEAHQLLINALVFGGKVDDALEAAERARKLMPKDVSLRQSAALVLAFRGEYKKAENELRASIKEAESHDERVSGYTGISLLYRHRGKFREAINVLDNAAETFWEQRDTLSAIGVLTEKLLTHAIGRNDVKGVRAELEEISPHLGKLTSPPQRGPLAFFRALEGNLVAADTLAGRVQWWRQTVQVVVYAGRQECARVEELADSVMLGTSFPFAKHVALYHLALCHYKEGNFGKALEALKRLPPVYHDWPGYYPKSIYLLAKVHEGKGDRILAVEQYERFLKLWKDADKDLPELIDAKARLAKLKAVG